MRSYKDTTFQDRAAQAAKAKQLALLKLQSKPPMDPAVAAEREVAGRRREAAEAEKREARKAVEQALRDERSAKAAVAAAKLAAVKPPLTDAERKLARDARYAARKNRK